MFSAGDLFFKAVFGPVFVVGCIGLVCLWYDYRRDWRFYSMLAILFAGFFWRFALGISTERYALFFVLPFVFLAAYGMRRLLKKQVVFWLAAALLVSGEVAKTAISARRDWSQRRFFQRVAAAAEPGAVWYCTQDIGSRFAFYGGVPRNQVKRITVGRRIPAGTKVYVLCRYRGQADFPKKGFRLRDRICLRSGWRPLYLLWGEYTGRTPGRLPDPKKK